MSYLFTSTRFAVRLARRSKNTFFDVVDLKTGKKRYGRFRSRYKAITHIAELELESVISELDALADLWLLPELIN